MGFTAFYKGLHSWLSALSALGIFNRVVELSDSEVPILDGSAKGFITLLESAGVSHLKALQSKIYIQDEIKVVDGDKFVKLTPSKKSSSENLSVNCKINFDQDGLEKIVGKQKLSLNINLESFKSEISNARTFTSLGVVKHLHQNGLALGGSLDNAVVFDDNKALNPEGLRYNNECVRHKILDAIGDLALVGMPIVGHYESYKPSHALHTKLVQKLIQAKNSYMISNYNPNMRNSFFVTKEVRRCA